MDHTFDTRMAAVYGTDPAIVIRNLDLWLKYNQAHRLNIRRGKVWSYATFSGLKEYMFYFSEDKIRRIIRKLEQEGVIEIAKLHKNKSVRTNWYTFTDEFIADWKHSLHTRNTHMANLPDGEYQDVMDYEDENDQYLVNKIEFANRKESDDYKDESSETLDTIHMAKSPDGIECTISNEKRKIYKKKKGSDKMPERQFMPSDEIAQTLLSFDHQWLKHLEEKFKLSSAELREWIEKFAEHSANQGNIHEPGSLRRHFASWLNKNRLTIQNIRRNKVSGKDDVEYLLNDFYYKTCKENMDYRDYIRFVMHMHGANDGNRIYERCLNMEEGITPNEFRSIRENLGTVADAIRLLDNIENSQYPTRSLYLSIKREINYAR